MNRINVICLGVRDMGRSLQFYRDGLGFRTDEQGSNPAVVFFSTTGTVFELYPLDLLAQDICEENPPAAGTGFGGVTLAINVRTKAEVAEVIDLARQAGAKIVKAPQDAFWGGYHAYFSDPDGYFWEVCWGPTFEFDDNDMLKI